MLSPEKYIRTKVRELPIYEVHILNDWEASGLPTIIVARKHPQGNITAGVYLVDLKCLGLKDTTWFFNKSEAYYREQLEGMGGNFGFEMITYDLAHNIIYEAIEFADQFHIPPHKDFDLTEFILEEDSEDIPYIEIECGENQIPHLIITPAMPAAKKYLANLKKYAGEGNYYYTYLDDYHDVADSNFEGNQYDEWEEDEDDEDENEEEKEEQEKRRMEIKAVYAMISLIYKSKMEPYYDSKSGKEIVQYLDSLRLVNYEDDIMERDEETLDEYYDYFYDENYSQALSILNRLLFKYPNHIFIYMLLDGYYAVTKNFTLGIENALTMIAKFPNHLASYTALIRHGLLSENLNKTDEILAGRYLPQDFIQENEVVSEGEINQFLCTMANYFAEKGDFSKVDAFIDALADYGEDTDFFCNLLIVISNFKRIHANISDEDIKNFDIKNYPANHPN